MNYYIDEYEIHTNSHELVHSGTSQKIEPQVFKLLCFMLENPDRAISRKKLMSEVWKPRIISDSALCAAISAAPNFHLIW